MTRFERRYVLILDVDIDGPDDEQTLDAAVESVIEWSTAKEAIETGLDGVSGWTLNDVTLFVEDPRDDFCPSCGEAHR